MLAKGTTANNVLSNLTKLESNPSVKLNSSLQISQKVWAAIKATKLTELVNCMASNGINPVLTGIDLKNNTENISLDDLKITQNDPIQLNGNGVFIKDKLAGWLNEDESKGYNYICGNVISSAGITESQEIGTITLDITNATSKQSLIMSGGKPKIMLNIEVVSKIENISGNFDVTKEENLRKIEKLSEQKMKDMCLSSIDKAKSLKSDIFGFGELIHRSNPKLWKSIKDSWSESVFVNLPVEINVKFKITGSDSITKSFVSAKE